MRNKSVGVWDDKAEGKHYPKSLSWLTSHTPPSGVRTLSGGVQNYICKCARTLGEISGVCQLPVCPPRKGDADNQPRPFGAAKLRGSITLIEPDL